MATIKDLIHTRSYLASDVLDYLKKVVEYTGRLPKYFPETIRKKRFEGLRQRVSVIEDTSGFDAYQVTQRENDRLAGLDDNLLYNPWRSRPELDRTGNEDDKAPKTLDWDDQARDKYHRAVILGDPGSGKTWLLKHEARRIAKENGTKLKTFKIKAEDVHLPIFIRLSDLAKEKDIPIEILLKNHIYSQLKRPCQVFKNWVEKIISEGKYSLFLDAWDEVPSEQQQNLKGKIRNFSKTSKARILLSSRVVGFDPNIDLLMDSYGSKAKILELICFESTQIEEFTKAWFKEQPELAEQFLERLDQQPQIQGLAKIPIMLSMLCRC